MESLYQPTPADYTSDVFNESSRCSSKAFPSNDNTPPSSTKDDDEQFGRISRIDVELQALFSESCTGKIWRTAANLIPANVGIFLS